MGSWGPGAFDNDDALDLLGWLAQRDEVGRRQALAKLCREAKDYPGPLSEWFSPQEVVAAVAVVAAGLGQGDAVRAEIAGLGYEASTVLIPESSPALVDDALAALFAAAGPDGEWHQGWVHAGTALKACETIDELDAIFYRYQHQYDQELPLEY